MISREELEAVVGGGAEKATAASPRHSGGLERHYAPRTPARLVPPHALDKEIAQARRTASRCSRSRAPTSASTTGCACRATPQAYAQRLYAALRELDERGLRSDPGRGAAASARMGRPCATG